MKSIILSFIVVILVLLCGCQTSSNTMPSAYKELNIDLSNPNLVTTKNVFKNIDFVKLETTDKSIFDNVGKVIHFDNKLFICTTLERGVSVLAFKDNGEFIFKLERGRAPEETIFPTDITIDAENNLLLVLDRYRVLKYYDFNGKYIKSINLDNDIMYCEMLGNKIISFDSDKDKKTNYYGKIWNKTEIEKQFMPKIISDIRKNPILYPYPFSKFSKDSLFVSCYFSDTIYCVSNKGENTSPCYVLNYNGRSANKADRLNKIKTLYEYGQLCNDQNYGSGPQNFVKSNNKLFFITQKYFVVYDLIQNIVTLHTNLFNGLPNRYSIAGYDQKSIIFSITTPQLMEYFEMNKSSESDSEIVKKLRAICTNEDDNPILLFCKF